MKDQDECAACGYYMIREFQLYTPLKEENGRLVKSGEPEFDYHNEGGEEDFETINTELLDRRLPFVISGDDFSPPIELRVCPKCGTVKMVNLWNEK